MRLRYNGFNLKIYNIQRNLLFFDMDILADQYLYKLNEFLPKACSLTLYDPEEGFPEDASQFDALLVRTVTAINKRTLPDTGRLQFIGSATAGTDHIDRDYLEECGIEFANSAGCNSQAVAEYVITTLYRWAEDFGVNPKKLRVGVVGCGHAGSALIRLLEKLNIETVMYDPPKEERDLGFQSASLKNLFDCDVLSFHTPLTHTGPHATWHLCSKLWLENEFQLIINTARGGVVDEAALLNAMAEGKVKGSILDVWEGEPVFSDEMAQKAVIATPHIAGYSRQAKWRASELVINKLCTFFGLNPQKNKMSEQVDESSLVIKEGMTFAKFMWENNIIDFYDRELLKLIGIQDKHKAEKFSKLRSETETRFEYRSIIKVAENKAALPELSDIFKNRKV